jgi:hypothetical protein
MPSFIVSYYEKTPLELSITEIENAKDKREANERAIMKLDQQLGAGKYTIHNVEEKK